MFRLLGGGGKTLTEGGGFECLVWLMLQVVSFFHVFNIPYFGEGIPIWTHMPIANGGWLTCFFYLCPPYFGEDILRLMRIFFGGWLKTSAKITQRVLGPGVIRTTRREVVQATHPWV